MTPEQKALLDEWHIPKPMQPQEGPRMFRLKGTRSHNGHITWVLRMYSIEFAAYRNLSLRRMYRRLAQEWRQQ